MVAPSFFPSRVAFCQSSNAAKLRRATPDVLSGKSACGGPGGPRPVKETTHARTHAHARMEERPLSSAASSAASRRPVLADSIDPANKHAGGVTSADQTDKQTNTQTKISVSILLSLRLCQGLGKAVDAGQTCLKYQRTKETVMVADGGATEAPSAHKCV